MSSATERLHRVVDIDDTRGHSASEVRSDGHLSAVSTCVSNDSSSVDIRKLETVCLRAERAGREGWAEVLPILKTHAAERPDQPQVWEYLAKAYLATGDSESAFKAASEALTLAPSKGLGYRLSQLVARKAAESRQWARAAEQAEAALASHPGCLDTLEILARSQAAQGQGDRAERTIDVLASSPAGTQRAGRLCMEFAKLGSVLAQKHRWVTKACTVGKGHQDQPWKKLGEICLAQHHDQEAMEAFQKAFNAPGGNADPELAQTLGRLLVLSGRFEEALTVFRAAFAHSPSDHSLQQRYCQLLLQRGHSQEAVSVMERAVKKCSPHEACSIYIRLAELRHSLGDEAEALRAWESAATANAGSVAAWKGLSQAAKLAGDEDLQRRAIQHLAKLEPRNIDHLLALSELQQKSAQGTTSAQAYLQQALRLAPPNSQLATQVQQKLAALAAKGPARAEQSQSRVDSLEKAADAFWSEGKYGDAASSYQSLVALQPDHGIGLLRLATTSLLMGTTYEAKSFLNRALAVDKPPQECLALMGYVQLLQGNREKASELMAQAMNRARSDIRPETRLYSCLVLAETGNEDLARRDFLEAARQHPALEALVQDKDRRTALSQGRLESCQLTTVLPAATGSLCRLLATLAEPQKTAASNGGEGGGGSRYLQPPPAATVTSSSASSRTPSAEGENSAPWQWRENISEGQPIEVYSKSAALWLRGSVVQVVGDIVKIGYLIDGQTCEKSLLRSSESLRWAPQATSSRARATFGPEPRGSHQASTSGHYAAPSTAAASKAPVAKVASYPGGCGSGSGGGSSNYAPYGQGSARGSASEHHRTSSGGDGSNGSGGGGGSGGGSSAAAGAAAAAVAAAAAAAALRPPIAAPSTAAKAATTSFQAAVDPKPPTVAGLLPDSTIGRAVRAARVEDLLLDASKLDFGTVLGTGGFGAVYRGRYAGDEVAIKKLHIADGVVTPAQIEEFRKEVENLRALRHPRLVCFIGAALVDHGNAGVPSLCIVTEFMPNGSLHALLHTRRDPLTFAQRLKMATQVAEGVVFLHSRTPPCVHRDLKSLNAVLDFDLNVKLCDFGLTQSMEKTHISRRDSEAGSPRYMAPELFDSRGKITEKIDVWALGCMIIEIMTGRLPHEECNSIQQVMSKVLIEKASPFASVTSMSKDLLRLAEAAFVFSPTTRADARALLELLKQVVTVWA